MQARRQHSQGLALNEAVTLEPAQLLGAHILRDLRNDPQQLTVPSNTTQGASP